MRFVTKLLTGLIVLAVGVGIFLAVIGVEPKDRRPGTRLAGELQPTPVDWRFSDAAMEMHLETYPWYGIPFSVTTVLSYDGQTLYVPSLYDSAMAFPGSKYWNRIVASDPNVRVRIGTDLYELAIAPITSEPEFERALAALARKYPFWADLQAKQAGTPPSERRFALLRLTPRST